MNLHFIREEFDARLFEARRRMNEQNLEGLLLFKQESMYYLTGYDTDGFVLFQALFLGLDGGLIQHFKATVLRCSENSASSSPFLSYSVP